MRRLAFFLVLAPASALADKTPALEINRIDPAGALDAEPLKGNVLVWHDAALYTSPADDASMLHVAALAGARREHVGHVVPMHVVATRGAFVEVELVDVPGCTWTRLATNDDIAKLRLFVKRADLAPVLVKPFDKTFADGTRIALKPGVAVVATSTGVYALSIRGHELAAEIPSASVGHAYTPERTKVIAMTGHEYAIDARTKVMLGDQTVSLDGLRAVATDKRADSTLVTFDDVCAVLTVAAPSKAVRALDDEEPEVGATSGLSTLDLRDSNYIPALTPLASGGGRQIAYAAKPIYLMGSPSGKNACIDRRVRIATVLAGAPAVDAGDVDDHVRLCVPASKVVHEKLRSARSANGSSTR